MIYPFPTKFRVTQTFQQHKKGGSRMPGTDYATPMNTPVYAHIDGWMQQESSSSLAGAVGFSITNGSRKDYVIHLTSVVNSHRNVKEGDLVGYTGNTGKSTGPHTHISKRINGVYYDIQAELEAAPLLSQIKPPVQAVDITPYQKQIDDLKAKLDSTLASNATEITKLEVEIISRQSQIDELTSKNIELGKYAKAYNLDLTGTAIDIGVATIEEFKKRTGVIQKWGNLIDRIFTGDGYFAKTAKGFFKYNMFIALYFAISNLIIYVSKLQIDPLIQFMITTGLSSIAKDLTTNYDTNGDTKLTKDDYIL